MLFIFLQLLLFRDWLNALNRFFIDFFCVCASVGTWLVVPYQYFIDERKKRHLEYELHIVESEKKETQLSFETQLSIDFDWYFLINCFSAHQTALKFEHFQQNSIE